MIDLEDGFTFEIAAGSRIDAETEVGGWRFSVRARLDGRFFEQFLLDVNIAVDDPRPVDRLTLRPVLHWARFDRSRAGGLPARRETACVRTDLFELETVEPREGPLRHARHGAGAPDACEQGTPKRGFAHLRAAGHDAADRTPRSTDAMGLALGSVRS